VAVTAPAPPPSIEQYGFDISQLLADRQLDEAENLLNEAIERYPAHPELLHIRVRLLEKRGDRQAALGELNRLLEIYRIQHLPEGCLRVAHQILALEPDNCDALDALSEAHLARHETSQAIRFLQTAARICLDRQRPEEALERLNRVRKICPPGSPEESRTQEERIQILALLERVPEAVQAQIDLAKILIRKELVGKAGEVLEKTIEIDPGCHEAHQMLVDLYLARGMQQQAIAQMQRLAEQYLAETPGRETEAAEAGVEKAIETYRRILDIDPGQTETRNKLALLYKHRGRLQEANEEYFSIARIYREKELLGRAVRIYENILKQDPRSERAHRALVEVLLEKGDETGAARQWSRFADSCLEAERYEEAESALREAVVLDPGSEDLLRKLIEVLIQTGQPQPALDASHLLLRLLESQSDTEKVKQCCEAILRLQPDDAEAAARLKRLEPEQAPAQLEIGQPGSVQAMVARAATLRGEKKFSEAIEGLKSRRETISSGRTWPRPACKPGCRIRRRKRGFTSPSGSKRKAATPRR
jgi:tetratricopeptide (TPR) repeat protein